MLRGLWACVVLVVATLACGIPAAVFSLIAPGSFATMRMGRLWGGAMLRAVGARVRYEGLDAAVAALPCVYISNHQSNVDIWALIRVLPLPTQFVAKQSLFRIPVLGWAMAASGFIPIDRTNRSRAIRSLRAAAQRVRDGRPAVLFAEGTRSKDGRLGRFKKGPFHLALSAGVPVVPVAISGSWSVMPPGSFRVCPGPVRVRFLPRVEVQSFDPEDSAGLMAAVHAAIDAAIEMPSSPVNPKNVAGVP
jgi:1-acyl-sn-glycerol-3-phosphate acyltransferase